MDRASQPARTGLTDRLAPDIARINFYRFCQLLEQQSAQRLYAALGRHLKYADGWKKFIITSEPEFEHYFGRRADKKRKLYNGMIKCDYYMYTDNSRKNQKRDDKK